MPRNVLDTSVLLRYWHERYARTKRVPTERETARWAAELAGLHRATGIVTPVAIEFLAGVRNPDELRLSRAYVNAFPFADQGEVLPLDWVEARRIAERVPLSGKPRQLGDCLVRAIANRLRCGVISYDKGFPG